MQARRWGRGTSCSFDRARCSLAPYPLVLHLIVIIGVVYVVRPTIILDVVLRHQMHGRHVAARGLAGQRAVQLVNKLPSGFVERLRDCSDLIVPGTHTVEGRHAAVSCGDKGRRAGGWDPGAAKRWSSEVEVEVVDAQSNRAAL